MGVYIFKLQIRAQYFENIFYVLYPNHKGPLGIEFSYPASEWEYGIWE